MIDRLDRRTTDLIEYPQSIVQRSHMLEHSLVSQIALGEDSLLELKTVSVPGKRVVYPDTRDIADEFAAAAVLSK